MPPPRNGLEEELSDGRVPVWALHSEVAALQDLQLCLRLLPAATLGDAHTKAAGRVLLNRRVDDEAVLRHVAEHQRQVCM